MTEDVVNHPTHYTQYPTEVIEIIQWVASQCKDGFEGYMIGNILKYLFRFPFKNGTEDLKKARWYLDKLVEYREGRE